MHEKGSLNSLADFYWISYKNFLKIDAWLKSMLELSTRRLYDWIRFSVSLEWLVVWLERSIISIGNIFKYTEYTDPTMQATCIEM